MGKLHIDQVTSGMVLAGEVTGRNGRLLLAAGVELTAGHLTILQTWGIREVDIEGVGEEGGVGIASLPLEITPEQRDQAMAELLPFFRHADLEQPAMNELLRMAAIRQVRHG